MSRHHLLRIGGAALLGLLIFSLSNDRGSAKGDPEDRKLEAFIEAAASVDGVMASWQPIIARASDNEAEALRRQANAEIRKSIEKVDGISLAEYREIRQSIAIDPGMLARVTEIMRRLDLRKTESKPRQ